MHADIMQRKFTKNILLFRLFLCLQMNVAELMKTEEDIGQQNDWQESDVPDGVQKLSHVKAV